MGKALPVWCGSADEGLAEVDDASHDDDERDVDLDGEVQELALEFSRLSYLLKSPPIK